MQSIKEDFVVVFEELFNESTVNGVLSNIGPQRVISYGLF